MTVNRSFRRVVPAIVLVAISLPLMVGQQCPFLPTPGTLTAEAGPDKTVSLGSAVVLEGSASGGTEVYGFLWTPGDGLSSSTAAQPTFTPTQTGTFTFSLTAADSAGTTDTDTMTVTVTGDDGDGDDGGDDGDDGDDGDGGVGGVLAVEAGADRVSTLDSPVALNGSATGGDGDYTILWTITSGTGGTLANEDTLTPTFTATQAGTFVLTLSATDGTGESESDTLSVLATTSTTLGSLTWGADYGDGGYEVLAVFSGELDETSAEDEENYRISLTEETPDSATLSSDGLTVTLIFNTRPLSRDAEFDISVSAGVRDATGSPVPQTSTLNPIENEDDTTAPGVSERKWGIDFAGSYSVEVVFTEAMDEDSVENNGSYRISEGSDDIPASTATLGEDGITVTLLFEDLPLSSTNAELDVGLTTLYDINGNAMTQATGLTISSNVLDVSGPNIIEDGITFVPNYSDTGAQLTVEFNEAMDKTSAETLTAYRVNGTATNPSEAELDEDSRTVTITFDTPLSASNTLDVSVGDAIKDINGNELELELDQTILGTPSDVTDPAAPTLMWVKGSVAGAYQLTAVFNEAMDESTVENVNNWRITGTSDKPTSGTLAADSRTVTLAFGVTMGRNDKIDVSVDDSIKDLNGNVLSAISLGVSANTEDTTSPTVTLGPTWASNGTNYQMTLTYSERMGDDSAGLTESYTMVRYDTIDAEVDDELCNPTSVVLAADGKELTLTFASTAAGFRRAGAPTTEDRLRIEPSVRDINGRPTTSALPLAVAASGEVTAPTIASTTWGINKGPYQINVTFNEVMDLASVSDTDNWHLDPGGANQKPTAATFSPDGKTAILTFGTGTFDSADTLAITNAVVDINNVAFAGAAGQAVAQAVATDTTNPSLLSAVWETNSADYRVTATFSEALDSATVAAADFTLDVVAPSTATLQDGGHTVLLIFTNNVFAYNAQLSFMTLDDMHGHTGTGSAMMTANATDTAGLDAFPVAANWVADFAGDAFGDYKLTLTFSAEVLDKTTAETTANYQINGTFIKPARAVLADTGAPETGIEITLWFSNIALSTTSTIDYSLAGSILDVNGNGLAQGLAQTINPAAGPADAIAPTVSSATETGVAEVTVVFDEVMDETTAETIGNYTWSGVVTTLSAELQTDGLTVILAVSADPTGEQLTVSSVGDINGNANIPYTSAAFP